MFVQSHLFHETQFSYPVQGFHDIVPEDDDARESGDEQGVGQVVRDVEPGEGVVEGPPRGISRELHTGHARETGVEGVVQRREDFGEETLVSLGQTLACKSVSVDRA